MSTTTILVLGNPVDGFTFIGPFDDGPAATGYAVSSFGNNADWITADIKEPVQDDPEMITYSVSAHHRMTVEDTTHPNDVRGEFLDWLQVHPDVIKLQEVQP